MPFATEHHAIEVDAPDVASTKADLASTPTADEFYNAMERHHIQM